MQHCPLSQIILSQITVIDKIMHVNPNVYASLQRYLLDSS